MSHDESGSTVDPQSDAVNVSDVLTQLEELEETITTSEQRQELRQTKHLLERMPGGGLFNEQIDKYTGRDMGEAFVGSIIFALPLLVEDGVFEIANHLLSVTMGGVPVFLLLNILFVITLATKLIYVVDIREVKITNPVLGVIPRRLIGVLSISFLTTAGLMILWGRVGVDNLATLEMVARITVIWAAAALGASLGDILPGESKGADLTLNNLSDKLAGEESPNSDEA